MNKIDENKLFGIIEQSIYTQNELEFKNSLFDAIAHCVENCNSQDSCDNCYHKIKTEFKINNALLINIASVGEELKYNFNINYCLIFTEEAYLNRTQFIIEYMPFYRLAIIS